MHHDQGNLLRGAVDSHGDLKDAALQVGIKLDLVRWRGPHQYACGQLGTLTNHPGSRGPPYCPCPRGYHCWALLKVHGRISLTFLEMLVPGLEPVCKAWSSAWEKLPLLSCHSLLIFAYMVLEVLRLEQSR
jgi:hypothetical protein